MNYIESCVVSYDTLQPDGRIIRKGAFADQDGAGVPLTSGTDKYGIRECIGTAILDDREDGVYVTCVLSNTPAAKAIKEFLNDQPNAVEMSIIVRAGKIRSVYVRGRR